MLGWLFPLGLAGLAALALPLLLHLARRREQRVLRFAAMRWLPTGRAPRRKLRIQERWLLLLRMALLGTAALWLAQPILHEAGRPQHWLAVSPEVDPEAAHRIAADFDYALWLAPALPALDDAPHDATDWLDSLEDFTARVPASDTATILTPATITSPGNDLPTLWHPVEWQEAPAATHPQTPAAQRVLALRYTDATSPSLHWLRTAITTWNEAPHLRVTLNDAPATTPIPATATAILWTGPLPNNPPLPTTTPLLIIPDPPPSPPGRGAGGEGPPPPSAPATPTTTTNPQAATGNTGPIPATPLHDTTATSVPPTPLPTTTHAKHPPHWRTLATPLHPSTVPSLYTPDFPHRLHATLFGTPHPTRIPATHLRNLPIATPPPNNSAPTALTPRGLRDLPLSPQLAWLLLALFLLERWFATSRRLGRTA